MKTMRNAFALSLILLGVSIAHPVLSQNKALGAPPSTDAMFLLLCKATYHGQLLTQNLLVDYGLKGVNGDKAPITDTMIVWSSNESNKVTRHELNRLSGTYRYGVDGAVYADVLPTYTCEKAPPQRF